MEVCGDVLTVLATICPLLGTLTMGVFTLLAVVLSTVINLVPVVVVMVFPVATAFSSFLFTFIGVPSSNQSGNQSVYRFFIKIFFSFHLPLEFQVLLLFHFISVLSFVGIPTILIGMSYFTTSPTNVRPSSCILHNFSLINFCLHDVNF